MQVPEVRSARDSHPARHQQSPAFLSGRAGRRPRSGVWEAPRRRRAPRPPCTVGDVVLERPAPRQFRQECRPRTTTPRSPSAFQVPLQGAWRGSGECLRRKESKCFQSSERRAEGKGKWASAPFRRRSVLIDAAGANVFAEHARAASPVWTRRSIPRPAGCVAGRGLLFVAGVFPERGGLPGT